MIELLVNIGSERELHVMNIPFVMSIYLADVLFVPLFISV